MAIFRVEKNKNYTVMSNYHLKDKSLSLKGKGLLSIILGLPDEWNYTTRGLAAICKEGVDCIGATLRELESFGYLERTQLRDEKGRITDTEYVIYESPQKKTGNDPKAGKSNTPMSNTPMPNTPVQNTPIQNTPLPDTSLPNTPVQNASVQNTLLPDMRKPNMILPDTRKPDTFLPDTSLPDTRKPDTPLPDTRKPDTPLPDTPSPYTPSPYTENPYMGESYTENPAQYNTNTIKSLNQLNTESSNINQSINQSVPYTRDNYPQSKPIDGIDKIDELAKFDQYRELVMKNIDYDYLCDRFNKATIDEIIEIMLDAICVKRDYISIGGTDYPAELVKSRLLKLNPMHIEYVIGCIKDNTTKVYKIDAYLLKCLYNAPATIGHYYTSLVNHDMANGFGNNTE